MENNVATINSQALTVIQAALNETDRGSFIFNLSDYLASQRTVGFTLPPEFIDYNLFNSSLQDTSKEVLVIVPNLDNWATIRDSFNHGLGGNDKFRIYNDEGEVIDAYVLGTSTHLKVAKLLKIGPEVKELVKVSPIHFMVHGVVKDMPRGITFEGLAENNKFVIKQLLARYLGRVHMFNEVSHSVEHDRSIRVRLHETDDRVKMDTVVIYESRKFFDRVRAKKFYDWLATQANHDTQVILIN